MSDDNIINYSQIGTFEDALTGLLRDGAHRLLCAAVETELDQFLQQFEDRRTLPLLHK